MKYGKQQMTKQQQLQSLIDDIENIKLQIELLRYDIEHKVKRKSNITDR